MNTANHYHIVVAINGIVSASIHVNHRAEAEEIAARYVQTIMACETEHAWLVTIFDWQYKEGTPGYDTHWSSWD